MLLDFTCKEGVSMKRCIAIFLLIFIVGCKINRGPEMRVCNHIDLDSIVCLFPRTVEEVQIMKQQMMQDFQDMLQHLDSFKSPFTMNFHNSLRVYDNAYYQFLMKSNVLRSMALLHDNTALQCAANQATLELDLFEEKVAKSSPKLLHFFKEFRSCTHDAASQRSDVRRFVRWKIDQLMYNGANLEGNHLKMVNLMKQQILDLESRYRGNISRSHSYILCSLEDLDGVDADFIKTLSLQNNQYVVPCDYNSFFVILESCRCADTRKRFFQKFGMRAYPENIAILKDLIGRRNQFAQIVGYDNFASYQLKSTMAGSVQNVEKMLWGVLGLIGSQVTQHFNEVTAHLPESVTLSPDSKLYPWDESFVYSQYRKKLIGMDDMQVSSYFELNYVVKSLRYMFEEFFHVMIDEIESPQVWTKNVVCWKIRKVKNNAVLGYILLDLYARDSKFDGPCHLSLVPAMTDDCNIGCRSAAIVVTNFVKKEQKTLLTIHDLKTLLHELGHAFHDVFGSTRFAEFSGVNVEKDFLEAPSQSLEFFTMVPEVLQRLSLDAKTQKKMPLSLAQKIVRAERIGKASMLERQCLLSLIALAFGKQLHGQTVEGVVEELYKKVRKYVVYDASYHFEAAFPHLSDYGSCYYGYVWSEILAAAMFKKMVTKHGKLHHVGHLFYDKVLQHGGFTNPHQLVENFVGEKAGYDDLLHVMV